MLLYIFNQKAGTQMIAVIDYGAGNLMSVTNALSHIGAECTVTADKKTIESADGIILPGVGAFGDAMKHLDDSGLTQTVKASADGSRPFLGICLGLQMLFSSSEESPGAKGLGVFDGTVRRFPHEKGLKVPHIGFNSVENVRHTGALSDVSDGTYFYFVHSYFVCCDDPGIVAAETFYGSRFVSAVQKEKLLACQFHPEKSGQAGLDLLVKFAEMCGGGNDAR